jgi:PKD repeat protein
MRLPTLNLRVWAVAGAIAVAALAFGVNRVAGTPAPDHLVWEMDSQNGLEQQGVSVAASSDPAPHLLAGLQTVPVTAPGNHIAARGYSGVDGTQVLTISAALQFTTSINTVAVISGYDASGASAFVVSTPRGSITDIPGFDNGLVRLFDYSGAELHQFNGPSAGSLFGTAVATAGDVNGDGTPNIIVGAPGANAVYIYSGNAGAGYPLLITLNGSAPGVGFGASVARVGQEPSVFGAPLILVAVGAPFNPGGGSGNNGRVYIYAISTAPLGASLQYSVTGSGANDLLGMSVDGGPDLNGDGVPDFLAGAIGTNAIGPTGTGYVNLYSGSDGSLIRTIQSTQNGDLFGYAARFGGPCLAISRTVIVGAPQALNPANNRVTGSVSVFNASNSAIMTSIYGEHQGEAMGTSASNAPDLTGDGENEFVVGAPGHPIAPLQFGAGAAFAYSCRPIPRPRVHAAPNPVDFGTLKVGASNHVDILLSNTGTAALHVTSVGLTAVSNPAFSYAGPVAFNLGAGASQTLTVHYAPATGAIHGGTLRVVSNDPLSPTLAILLNGQGLLASLQVTPTSIAFSSIDVSDTAWAKVSMQNTGNVSLTVNTVGYLAGSSPDFTLGAAPTLPLVLQPLQTGSFQVIFKPTAIASRSGTLRIGSTDPVHPLISVPVSGSGVKQNIPPTAVITMAVPYTFASNQMTVQYYGNGSYDPDDAIVSYAWDFGDGATSNLENPMHSFNDLTVCPCYYIVRLTVTDVGGKMDVTSITVPVPTPLPVPPSLATTLRVVSTAGLSLSLPDKTAPTAVSANAEGIIRSRFWGAIRVNGANVPEGTVVQAWVKVNGVLTDVAESLTQLHLGQSVYAIEIQPYFTLTGTQPGGTDGVSVTFRYNGVDANQTGTWWNATDQRIDLTSNRWLWAPQSIPCSYIVRVGLCGSNDTIAHLHVYVQLIDHIFPPIGPGPLRIVDIFSLSMTDANTGGQVTSPGGYDMHVSYTDAELATAGVNDEKHLGLFYLSGNQWVPAGASMVDTLNKQVITHLNHASVFALAQGGFVYLPLVSR